jgi:hypothetical protein
MRMVRRTSSCGEQVNDFAALRTDDSLSYFAAFLIGPDGSKLHVACT